MNTTGTMGKSNRAAVDATEPGHTNAQDRRDSASLPPLILRDYQQAWFDAYDAGFRRFFLPWHRRAGKDISGLEFIRETSKKEIGNYWHMFPIQAQAKRAIWNGIADDGVRFLDRAFPPETRAYVDKRDLYIEFTWGSTYQMLGSDRFDAHVGANTRGILLSEWALCNPAAWDYFRPIVRVNGGWAAFIMTFRGFNHAWKMYQKVSKLPNWYVDMRTVLDTHKADGSRVVTDDDIELERAEGVSEALIQQEYFLNPLAAPEGSYYGHQFAARMA